jgi:monothiol glutaredoxin
MQTTNNHPTLPPDLVNKLEAAIRSEDLVLFMKGDRTFPQCGFSARVVDVFERLQARFKTYDILSDEELRTGLKIYSNWPTFPQIYVKGELIGGHDILMTMFQNGELETLLKQHQILSAEK